MLSMFPLYIFLFIFDISFFLRNHNGNKSVQLFCAIPVAIVFLNCFSKFCNYIVNNFFVYLHDDEINLPKPTITRKKFLCSSYGCLAGEAYKKQSFKQRAFGLLKLKFCSHLEIKLITKRLSI